MRFFILTLIVCILFRPSDAITPTKCLTNYKKARSDYSTIPPITQCDRLRSELIGACKRKNSAVRRGSCFVSLYQGRNTLSGSQCLNILKNAPALLKTKQDNCVDPNSEICQVADGLMRCIPQNSQ